MVNYDVFISYKTSDENNIPTRDAQMADSLYWALRNKGYSPFLDKYCIEGSGKANYMSSIANAIEKAKVFVAVGTSRKHIDSRWVKREINMFSAKMMNEPEGERTLFSYRSPDFSVNELPADLADLQSYDNETAVLRFIDIVLKQASGFRNDGFETTLLYDKAFQEEETELIKNTAHSDQWLKAGNEIDGRYTILREIGRGGMSHVHLAMDKRINKTLAVKEVRKDSSVNFEIVLNSMREETNLLKELSHPAIPAIIDIIENPDVFLTVMEYIEGETLQNVLTTNGAQTQEFVIDVAYQLADVLNYLHTRQSPIIYRDMKPANIILQPNGRVRLIDFGVARKYKPEALNDTVCLGTRGYAAPEQFGGMGQTDARTDIYNLGVTLFHLVTGKSPNEPPYQIWPIREINPELSKGLEYIIERCTQKDPADRFQSAKELLEALDNIDALSKKRSYYAAFNLKKRTQKTKTPLVPKPKKPKQLGFAVPTVPAAQPVLPKPGTPIINTSTMPIPVKSKTELEYITAKFAKLDPDSKKIVKDLIEKLSK